MGLTKMAADLSFPWHIYIFKGFWGVQRGFLQKAPLAFFRSPYSCSQSSLWGAGMTAELQKRP